MSTAAVSGTKVKIELRIPAGSGNWLEVSGETSHSANQARELIEVSSKTNANVRCTIPNEGRKTLDVTIDTNTDFTDAITQSLRSQCEIGDDIDLRIVKGTTPNAETIQALMQVASVSDTAGDGAAHTTSYSLQDNGGYTRTVA